MEAFAESDDAVLAGVEGSQLGGVFIGFRAAVVQEKAVVLKAAGAAQTGCKLLLKWVAHAVGVETYLGELVCKDFNIVGMAVADADNGVAAIEV